MRRIDPVLTSFTDGVRSGADHFTQLGLPKRFDLDPKALEERYRELSRSLHPDRFAKAEPNERMLSVMASRALNDAYRLLKDPVKRAEYLLSLSGTQISEHDKVGQEFLMEILELRETLAEAKASGDAAQVEALAGQVRARRDAAMVAAAELLQAAAPASGEAGAAPVIPATQREEIKHHLIAVRYFQRFLDEVTGDEEP